jgi:hypothetical protein
MKVLPEDMKAVSEVKAVPDWTQIVSLPPGVANGGPCRNPEHDRGAGGKFPKRAGLHIRDLRCC